MKKSLLAIFCIFLIILIYFTLFKKEEKIVYESQILTPSRLSIKVEAIGEVYAKTQVDVGSQVSGQVIKIYVKLGDFVTKGALIAQIDQDKQQNNVDITNARLQSAKTNKKSLDVAFEIAKSQYERQSGLYKRKASSKTQFEEKQSLYYKLMAQQKESEAKIKELEISLKNAKKDLGYTRILAPMDGYIVNIAVDEGQIVNAVQSIPTIARLAKLDEMEIRMQIAEADINKIKKNQKVKFSILSDPDKKYEAKVAEVDLGNTGLSDAKSGSYSSNASTDAIYYYARAFVKNENNFLRIGMSVQNEIEIKALENILAVPTTAIKKDKNGFFVQLLKNEKIQKSYVKLGLRAALRTQILSGLKENDRVVSFIKK